MRPPVFSIIAALACFNIEPARSELRCRIDLQVALPLSYVSNLAVVETNINGVRALLALDTGAKTLLTPEAVRSLGLPRDWRRTRAVGTTAILISHNYIVRDLEFAGHHYQYSSFPAFAIRQDGAAIKGLLRTDILADFDLDFDFPGKKLNVYKVSGCKTLTPPDFTSASSIRFSFNSQRGAVLDAELDGKKFTALIDTGATNLYITRAAARRLKDMAATVNTDLSLDGTGIGNVTVKQRHHQLDTSNNRVLSLLRA
jgi:predicted aspartyl protease